MDWNLAIEKHSEALKRVIAMLVAMAGLSDSDPPAWVPRPFGERCRAQLAGEGYSLPRHLHRAILRLLRPAEAAARRLIVVAARGLVVLPGPQRPAITETISPYGRSGRCSHRPSRRQDQPHGGRRCRSSIRCAMGPAAGNVPPTPCRASVFPAGAIRPHASPGQRRP